MALPTSRNTTYAPSSPILSADLNALQDCIIGGKRGDGELVLGAGLWVADTANTSLNQNGYLATLGAAKAYAYFRAPVGWRIKTVTVYYNPNGGGNQQPKLQRMDITTGTITAIWTGALDNTGAVIESQTNSPNHVMLTQNVYWLENLHSGVANRTYGGIVLFDVP